MVITGSSSVTRVSEFIAQLQSEKSNTVRQRLKEWYQDSNAKKGKKRRELDISECFAPLLSLNVLYQGCGIAGAWKIVKGTEKGSWKPHWQKLFQLLKDAVASDWQVIVCADRGLYADWLFEEICALNWHPFLRINHQGTYQIRGQQEWRCLDTVVPHTGMSWSGVVTCFKSNPKKL